MTYVCGWFVSFFVFELTAVPFILLEKRFTSFVIAYSAVIFALFAYGVWTSKSVWADFAKNIKGAFRQQPLLVKAGWLLAYALIGVQL